MQASGGSEFECNTSGLIEKVSEVGGALRIVRCGGWIDGVVGGR